jgi:hypothetical protein
MAKEDPEGSPRSGIVRGEDCSGNTGSGGEGISRGRMLRGGMLLSEVSHTTHQRGLSYHDCPVRCSDKGS